MTRAAAEAFAPTVPAAFAESVRRFGSRIAAIGEDGASLTYAELDAQRIAAARALLACGVRAGERVAIWAPNSVEWMIAGLAIHSVGAAIVPINTRMKGQEAGYLLQKSAARVLLCAGDFLGQHYPGVLGTHRPASLETIVVLGSARPRELSWPEFLRRGDAVPAAEVERRAAAVLPDACMDVMFTSGTTGLPKGVVTNQGQNLRVFAEFGARLGLVPEDRYLVVNPFFHVFGYKAGWLVGLLKGCTVLPHAVFDAAAVMRRISLQRISVLPGPPTLFISLLDDPQRAGHDLSSLRATITGAAAVAPSLVERIRADLGFKVVLTGYGLTESCGVVSLCDASDDAQTIVTTCGKPIPGTEVRIDAAPGTAGEILVRGHNVMQGYLDDEAATREAVDAGGWLHTGDVGLLDAHGYLRITDRLKDMYIAGGFNCYPAEIERMMAAHPAVGQVAVIGVPDERLGEVGKACVVPKPGQRIEPAELIAWCRGQMANYKVPRYVEVMNALPLNAAGKVMKFQLRNPAEIT
ncbi:MAG TPA: FadD3 family acyl-CoA ligase [Candidatus Binatia bacterium]|nr:FadD3 family acyl-CoA ligase [Candidatus Binatia bacterium]